MLTEKRGLSLFIAEPQKQMGVEELIEVLVTALDNGIWRRRCPGMARSEIRGFYPPRRSFRLVFHFHESRSPREKAEISRKCTLSLSLTSHQGTLYAQTAMRRNWRALMNTSLSNRPRTGMGDAAAHTCPPTISRRGEPCYSPQCAPHT